MPGLSVCFAALSAPLQAEPCCRAVQAAIKKQWFLQCPWDRSSPPHTAAMLAVLHEVAQGMAFLHAHSIIHGDLNACV